MDTIDAHGKIQPLQVTEQSLISKKVTDKDGQGQGTHFQGQQKTASPQLPEEEKEEAQVETHVIDIVV